MAKKKKTGGRNPVEPAEKVVLVGFYTKKKFIDFVGGMEKARKFSKDQLEANMYAASAKAFLSQD